MLFKLFKLLFSRENLLHPKDGVTEQSNGNRKSRENTKTLVRSRQWMEDQRKERNGVKHARDTDTNTKI